MKSFAAFLLLVFGSQSFAKGTLTINSAEFNYTGPEAIALYHAFANVGAKTDDGHGMKIVEISNALIQWREKNGEGGDPKDPCSKQTGYEIQFQDQNNGNKWSVLNANRDCRGIEAEKAEAIVRALHGVGFNRVSTDDALAGRRAQTLTAVYVGAKANDGAIGSIGAPLTENPPE